MHMPKKIIIRVAKKFYNHRKKNSLKKVFKNKRDEIKRGKNFKGKFSPKLLIFTPHQYQRSALEQKKELENNFNIFALSLKKVSSAKITHTIKARERNSHR